MKDLLTGKKIVVTGSGSGIGWESAKVLAEQGAFVLGVDLNKKFDHVDELYRADMSDPRAIDALIDVLPDDIDVPTQRVVGRSYVTLSAAGAKSDIVSFVPSRMACPS